MAFLGCCRSRESGHRQAGSYLEYEYKGESEAVEASIEELTKARERDIEDSEIRRIAQALFEQLDKCRFLEVEPRILRLACAEFFKASATKEMIGKRLEFLTAALRIDTMEYDVKRGKVDDLAGLSKVLSEYLGAVSIADTPPLEVIITLLEEYENLICRLWLLAHLCKSRVLYRKVVEDVGPELIESSGVWIRFLQKSFQNDDSRQKTLDSVVASLDRLVEPISKEFGEQFEELLKEVGHPMFFGLLAQIYRLSSANGQAIRCYEHCLSRIGEALRAEQRKAEESSSPYGSISSVSSSSEDNLRDLRHQVTIALGQTYLVINEYNHAHRWYSAALKGARDNHSNYQECEARLGLGLALHQLGKYREAEENHIIALSSARNSRSKEGESAALLNLGIINHAIGQNSKALEFFKEARVVSEAIGHRQNLARAFGNIGLQYQIYEDYQAAIDNHKKSLKVASEIGDFETQAQAYLNLGSVYLYHLEEFRSAQDMYERALSVIKDKGIHTLESVAYGALGSAFRGQQKFDEAKKATRKSLALSERNGSPIGIAMAHQNLGFIYDAKGEKRMAYKEYHAASTVYSTLIANLTADEKKISVIETVSAPYLCIENLLIGLCEVEKALATTESRRSISLRSAMFTHPSSFSVQGEELQEIRFAEISTFAKEAKINLIYYSLAPTINGESMAYIWCVFGEKTTHSIIEISEIGEIADIRISKKSNSPEEPKRKKESKVILELDEHVDLRGRSNPAAAKNRAFRKKLQTWYATFIGPIKELLPEGAKLTIVPDGFLSQLPFAIFMDEEGKYLIEDHPISIAPSIQVLKLLQKRKTARDSAEGALIVGNPEAGIEAAELPMAELEAQRLKAILSTSDEKVLLRGQAKVGAVTAAMKDTNYIHLACHGEPNLKTNIHSVFEGAFLMSPDEKHVKGLLYAEEIGKLDLKADLVFLSACHSGKGAIKQEGVIGHMRSFLAAGASSVVGTLWSLPDSGLTVDMVTGFYERVTAGMPKDEALREVMLMAIERKRNSPHAWGAFVLTGLAD